MTEPFICQNEGKLCTHKAETKIELCILEYLLPMKHCEPQAHLKDFKECPVIVSLKKISKIRIVP